LPLFFFGVLIAPIQSVKDFTPAPFLMGRQSIVKTTCARTHHFPAVASVSDRRTLCPEEVLLIEIGTFLTNNLETLEMFRHLNAFPA
jgi:hypothetical protein